MEKIFCKFNVCPARITKIFKKIKNYTSKKDFDFNLIVGGDGTFLRYFHKIKISKPFIFLRDKMSFGGLAELSIEDFDFMLKKILEKEYFIESLMLLRVKKHFALNDIYIKHFDGSKSIMYEIETNNFYDRKIGDGIIFATPQGSFGYTKSAGGPQVLLKRIVVTHISPFKYVKFENRIKKANSENFQIFDEDEKITFKLLWENANLYVDGRLVEKKIKPKAKLKIKKAEKEAKIVRFFKKEFKFAVDAIIEKDGKFLLARRNYEPFKGKLALIGGFIENNEKPIDAIKRELKEEVGLEVKSYREFKHYFEANRDPRGNVYSIVFEI
ncbi:MAG: NUDIX domain-containing protein, partial [Candidatus Aenigmatarchaeota archaeon]